MCQGDQCPSNPSPELSPKGHICWSSPPSASMEVMDKDAHRVLVCLCVMPKPPSLLIMVIQSRLSVQTFRFDGVPRQSLRNYLSPPNPLLQDDSINISNTSRKWLFSSTIHCNESNLFSLKNCTFSLSSAVPRRQEERTSSIQMIRSPPRPTSLK